MRILITGSHGFIGSALKHHLTDQGHEIQGLDRHLLYAPHALQGLLTAFNPHGIIHTASYGNLASQIEPHDIVVANVLLLHTLLEASKTVPYQFFLNFSSSSVTLPTQTLYAQTKAMGEQVSTFFARVYDKPIVNIRPYSVTGVGEHPEHLIPTLIRAAYSGEVIQFAPTPVHDFIDISDFCTAIDTVIANIASLVGVPIDIGTGSMTTNSKVLDLVESTTQRKINVQEVTQFRTYDTKYWRANPVQLFRHNWTPKKDIRQIIKEMVYDYPI